MHGLRLGHARGRPRAEHLGDAEVEHLDAGRAVGARGEEEVGGLEVAVDDAERVRLGERLAGLQHVVDGLGRGEVAALLERPREVAALEVLHHDVRRRRSRAGRRRGRARRARS